MSETNLSYFSIIGLAINIIGVWFISRGIMKKPTKSFISESFMTWGCNDDYVINGYLQRIECNCGFILVLMGSIFQVVDYMFKDVFYIKATHYYIVIVFFVIVIFVCAVLLIALNLFVRKAHKKYVKKYLYFSYYKTENAINKKNEDDLRRHIRYIDLNYDLEKRKSLEEIKNKIIKELGITN